MKTKTNLVIIVLMLIALLGVAACSATTTPTPSDVAPVETSIPEAAAPSEEPEDIPEVVDIGDALVIYTAEPDASMEILLEGWYAMYPNTKVDIIYGSAGEMTSRIIAEADNPQADIMFSGINGGDGDKYRPYFEDYLSTHDEELFEEYRNNNGYYNYVIVSPSVFFLNHTLLNELGVTSVENYDDLLQPELKGLVVTSDPNSASAGWNNLNNILNVYSENIEDAWDYIDQLMANGLVITSSSSAVFTSVSNGEYAVGLTYEGGAANQIRNGITDCEIVFPSDGNGAIVTAAAIVKNAPHREAAIAWVEYVTSADGQAAWAQQLGTTRVTNSKAVFETAYLQPYESIKWVPRDIDWQVENRSYILDNWNALYNKNN